MDRTWQKNLLAFLGLLAALGTVLGFVYRVGGEEGRAPASSPQAELDKRLEGERKAIVAFVVARTSAAEVKLDTIGSTLQDFKSETRESLKKLDDRLYEMQRKHSAELEREGLNGG